MVPRRRQYRELGGRRRNTEMIGRTDFGVGVYEIDRAKFRQSYDTSRPNYEWWDKFWRGEQEGYELASQLARPIPLIRTVWALGDGLKFRLRANIENERIKYTNEQLSEWGASVRSDLSSLLKNLDRLGDQYAIMNMDASISIPSPDTVQVIRDKMDYRLVVAVIVTTILADVDLTDTYTANLRTIRIKNKTDKEIPSRYGEIPAKTEIEVSFDNPLGVIPVAMFHNDRSANETNGRPIVADDRFLLSRYDDLASKGLDGAAIMGNPIPTWHHVDNVERERQALEQPTGGRDPDTGEPLMGIAFESNAAIVTEGDFDFKSPGVGFTKDIRDMLKLLFLLMLEGKAIPETVWGGELGQSRSSTQEQMKTFYAMIDGWRIDLEGSFDSSKQKIEGVVGLASLWLRVKAMTDKRLVVDAITTDWPVLAQMDEKLMFEKLKYLHEQGIISDATAVDRMNVVDDPEGEVEKAKAEADANRDPFDKDIDDGLEDEEDDEEEPPVDAKKAA